ncbi:hypothetical protein PSPO01_07054 [Paraphaeosphaeria sporulosa]
MHAVAEETRLECIGCSYAPRTHFLSSKHPKPHLLRHTGRASSLRTYWKAWNMENLEMD